MQILPTLKDIGLGLGFTE